MELNDVGYMRQADDILEVIWVGYRVFEPFPVFRNLNLNFNQWTEWNFAKELTGPGGNINAHTQFKNYWRLDLGGNYNGEGLATSELRGTGAESDRNDQKKLMVEYQMMGLEGNVKNSKSIYNYNVSLGYRPSKSLKITVSPSLTTNNDELQYVTHQDYDNITDYLFARINQKNWSASLRVSYNITPDLSLEYWGQPFLSSGKYTDFKRITNSRASKYSDRFSLLNGEELTYASVDKMYQVSAIDGNLLYRFDQPDFNTREFLSNMVARWEYRPGSTLYLVWSQTRSQSIVYGSFDFKNDLTGLFDNKPYNVFLVKMSFRLGK